MRSIRPRFLFISALTIALALLATGFAFSYFFERNLQDRIDGELTVILNRLAAGISFSAEGEIQPPGNMIDPRFDTPYGGLYWQIQDEGQQDVLRSRSLWDYSLPLPEAAGAAGSISRYTLEGPEAEPVIVQERSLLIAAPGEVRTVRMAAAIARSVLDKAHARFIRDTIPYLLILGTFLLAGSVLQAVIGLRPLSRLSADLDRIREGKSRRLGTSHPREVSELVGAFNRLMEVQDETLRKAQTRAGDLAHALKTPLTILSGRARKLRAGGEVESASEIDEMVSRMRDHVEYELARSTIAARSGDPSRSADLGEVLTDLVRTLARMPKGETVEWEVGETAGIQVKVNPHDLRELVGNLLDNALKWTRSTVRISVQKEEPGTVVLEIADDGPGIPPERIDSLTMRGQRLDRKVHGSGLGLAIAADISDAYGLGLRLQNRQREGLRATVKFPALP